MKYMKKMLLGRDVKQILLGLSLMLIGVSILFVSLPIKPVSVSAADSGGITGKTFISGCPRQRPGQSCQKENPGALVIVYDETGTTEVIRFTSNVQNSKFKQALPQGNYVITGNPGVRCPHLFAEVTVPEHGFVNLDLVFDSCLR